MRPYNFKDSKLSNLSCFESPFRIFRTTLSKARAVKNNDPKYLHLCKNENFSTPYLLEVPHPVFELFSHLKVSLTLDKIFSFINLAQKLPAKYSA